MYRRSIFVCLYLLFLATAADSTSLSKEEEEFLIDCLKQRHDLVWMQSQYGRSRAKQCAKYLETIRTTTSGNSGNVSTSRKTQLGNGIFSYLSALINWRNDEGTLEGLLLDRVATCHLQSRDFKSYWEDFFHRRAQTIGVSPVVISKSWQNTRGEITLKPSSTSRSSEELVAAELVISRSSPSEIGERFGRYMITITSTGGNLGDQQLYSGFVSSCAHEKGRMMVLDLSIETVRKWYRNRNENLTLSVAIVPRRQYLNPPDSRLVNVVEEIAGIVMHFQRTRRNRAAADHSKRKPRAIHERTYGNLPGVYHNNHADDHSGDGGVVRRRRSAAVDLQRGSTIAVDVPRPAEIQGPCEITNLVLNETIPRSLNVMWPESGPSSWNIFECVGICQSLPGLDDLTPRHAFYSSLDPNGDVCCVPLEYEDMHYIYNEDGEMVTNMLPSMAASRCGCR